MKACQVVPDIPSFAVDDGFTYLVPTNMEVRVGSRVRITVSGRKLKGFVTAVFDVPPGRELLPLRGVVGTVPSFDERTLPVMRWAASHYIAPLSTILKRTIPPNVPRSSSWALAERPAKTPTRHVVISSCRDHARNVLSAVRPVLERGASAMVVVPSVTEATAMATSLSGHVRDRIVVATSASANKDATTSWVAAASPEPTILVGTREIMLWPMPQMGIAVVVEDARRVMKSPSTPTLGVREVLIARSADEAFDLTFITPVPSLETLADGVEVHEPSGRQWPLVEVVDRTHEPPSRTVIVERTMAAISAAVARGERVFVLVPSRGYAPAFRCVACGTLRRCAVCDTAASRTNECRRCGAELGSCAQCRTSRFEPLGAGIGSVRDAIARSVGDQVGVSGDDALVIVGSERDLVSCQDVSLAVAVDVDGMAHAPTYRASEDALRLLVRLAHLVPKGRGNRMVVQTASADQPVVAALRSGRSGAFLDALAAERRSSGFPPSGELIALEIDRRVPVGDTIARAIGSTARVLGPAPMRDRDRWLIQGADLTAARVALRGVVGTLRDKGARVRVDVDPIDL